MGKALHIVSLLLLALPLGLTQQVTQPIARGFATENKVTLSQSDGHVTLANGFVKVVISPALHSVVEVSADYTGGGSFRSNLLSSPGILIGGSDIKGAGYGIAWKTDIIDGRPGHVSVHFGTTSPAQDPELTLSLDANDHGIGVKVAFPAAENSKKSAGGVRFYLRQFLLMGLFEHGVVQGIAGQKQFFTSRDPLRLFYTMDRKNGSIALIPEGPLAEVALLSGDGSLFQSGIELRTGVSQEKPNTWRKFPPERSVPGAARAAGPLAFRLYANDLPFPAHQSDRFIESSDDPKGQDSTAYLSAVYGSAAGVLGSYHERGSAYPTLAFPDRPYGDAFNFFDPDTWSVVNALAFSGDPLLQREAREILERSEAGMLRDGQIPHHFEGRKPVFLSIAKSKQTGPNIFWALAAIQFAAGSGDVPWLRSHYAHLRQAAEWILAHFDEKDSLLHAEGPLFIDVFRRSGGTLDTNVMAIYLLNRMAEAAEVCGDSAGTRRYLDFANKLKTGLRRRLWNGDDHFLTQRNSDGSTRDFVDYDGNFAALAFGVLDDRVAEEKLLHRLDSGQHTHPGGRGTWVSEKRYEKADCYGENDGDSDVAMARIWWLDMLARVRMKDEATFDRLLGNIEGDLLRDVWLPERYDAAGAPAHNGYYHEYPDILTMVLREMRYGIQVGNRDVTVRPFGPSAYRFHMGALQVDYARDEFSVQVPGSGMRRFTVGGLPPFTEYKLSNGENVVSDEDGSLKFAASAGVPVSAERSGRHITKPQQ